MTHTDTKKLYESVIDDVCSKVRDALIEEGYDQHTLDELKTLWLNRLNNSKALEPMPSSTCDDPTKRTFRHPNPNANSSGTISNIATRTLQTSTRPVQIHEASASAVSLSSSNNAMPVKTLHPTVQMTSLLAGASMPIINVGSTNATQVFPSNISTNRPNGTGLMGTTARTSTQLDGNHDPPDEMAMNNRDNRMGSKKRKIEICLQLDGPGPPGSDEEDEDADNDEEANDPGDDLEDDDDDDANGEGKEDGKPLCSEDDVSEDDPTELFDADNVIVCQYDKISRTKNKWRFNLKSGVMNLHGRDFIFNKASGEADW